MVNPVIFKSYDIRGEYPSEIDERAAEAIGRATAAKLGAKAIAVGRDNRDSSPSLFSAFARGAMTEGADVIDLGLVSTPQLYFASSTIGVDGAAMITASHNPPQYNGIKICGKHAVPLGLSSGLADIRDIVNAENFPASRNLGNTTIRNIATEYHAFLSSFADIGTARFGVAVDCAHAMGALELPVLEGLSGVALVARLYDTIAKPGTCPHEANPLKTETLAELAREVRKTRADFGIAFDGDADRVGFIDDLGRAVPMDLVTAIIAPEVLRRHPGGTVLYDIRSSRAVREEIERAGGIAHACKVGHANIKKQMRDEGAVFAGELSGHYYFSEGGYAAEMGALPAIMLMNILARAEKPLSAIIDRVRRYAHTGEIDLHVPGTPALFARVKQQYADGTLDELDGIRIDYPDWWFSLRASNTEPVIRLNIEASTRELAERKKRELLDIIA